MLHYYIYYRVDPEHTLEADAAVGQVQFEIQTELGIQGRLLRKRDESLLWMEVYENVSSAPVFEAALARALSKSGLEAWLAERRHVECFEG